MKRALSLDGQVLTREEMQELTARILSFSRAERARVNVGSGVTRNLRFAANQLSTSGSIENVGIGVESWFGAKHASVSTNDISDDGLRRAVEQSEALARLQPDDPEDMPLLGPQTYQTINAYFDSTADLSPEDRARAALSALEMARSAGDLEAAGYIVTSAGSQGLANSEGLFAYHRSTSANYTLTVRTADGTGSGWAGADHRDWRRLDIAAIAQRATEKARASRNPVAIEPGRYTVILEPQAVGDLVRLLLFAMNARTADEGRSAFSKPGGGNKIGEKIVDERVTMVSDPADPDVLAAPFDGEGLPIGRRVWVENGVLRQLFYPRYWAMRQNREPTGFPAGGKLEGGRQTIEEMITATPRGILLTRLWYLRQVDPRTILYTGLTRDGTFLIEDGRIVRPVQNFRFNESPLFMLNNLESLGPAQRIAGAEGGGNIVMPAIKARDFTFTSLSEAV